MNTYIETYYIYLYIYVKYVKYIKVFNIFSPKRLKPGPSNTALHGYWRIHVSTKVMEYVYSVLDYGKRYVKIVFLLVV